MPIYEFVCESNHHFERSVRMDDRHNTQECPECGDTALMIITPVRSMLDGTDPSLPGAYMAWERRHSKH